MVYQKFKLILCDLGNVLLNFDHRIAVRRIQNFTNKDFDDIYDLFFDSPLTLDFEEGRVSPKGFFHRVDQKLQLKNLKFNDFIAIWNDIFFDNEGVIELLTTLKKKHRLHLISNINELHYRYILKKFPRHLEVFDKLYLSYEVGHCKPHAEIYRQAIEEAGFKPGEAIYIDDRLDLIKEAKRLGIKSVPFKSLDDVKKQLKKLKVLG